jgi:hypothetical protein
MGVRQFNEHCMDKAQIEIPATLLAQLIASGQLPGGECKCLDNTARKTLWQSLLNSSLVGIAS